MKHVKISTLEPGNRLESVYLIRDVYKRSKKNGEPYISLNLQDATGRVNAMMWDKVDLFMKNQLSPGDFAAFKADVGLYNGKVQLTIRGVDIVDPNLVDPGLFLPQSQRPILEMRTELFQWIDGVKTPHLKKLLDTFFNDEDFLRNFLRAPSARTMHQAYIGGLVEHTLGVVKNAMTLADNYQEFGIDADLLITAALLHDGSKVFEYTYRTSIDMTDKGRLVGHLSMMATEIEIRARRIEEFPEEDKILLQHMILSHHGKLEYGSPKVPMTAEALILSYADYIDAYLSTFFEKQKEAHEKGERWTDWVDMFGHFLYAGDPPPEGHIPDIEG